MKVYQYHSKKSSIKQIYVLSLQLCLGAMICINSACKNEGSLNKFVEINASYSGVSFSNILKEDNNLNYFTYPYLYMGGGVAVGDINNDGLDDIYFTGNMTSNKLYLNKGNFVFEDITLKSGTGGDNRWYSGVTMVDINADGYLDLYTSVSGKENSSKNQLFINNGDLSFTEKANKYGIDDDGKSVQSTFFDYDKDGDLDLYVTNYPITPFATKNRTYRKLMDNVELKDSDHLYRNEGNGLFKNVTEESGLLSFGLSLSATVGDLNNDNWEDLYISNDFSTPDYLYLNNGDGTFTESLQKSTKQTSFYGMGADIADYNNDGLLDIVQVDMAAEDNRRAKANMASMNPDLFWSTVDFGMHYQYMFNSLQLNRGIEDNIPVFSNAAWIGGVATTDWSWGPLFADFNNDGWKDLFVSNGTRRDINNRDFFAGLKKDLTKVSEDELKLEVRKIPSEPIANYIFKNNGDLTFSKVNKSWGIERLGFSNGVAYADLNNDGRLDLVVNNIDEPAYIYKNEINNGDHNYLIIELNQLDANRNCLGAKVEVITKNNIQFQHLTLTRGFQSSVAPKLYFGLASATIVDSLIVTWPDGTKAYKTKIDVNQKLKINKGDLEKYALKTSAEKKIFKLVTDNRGLPDHVENVFDDYKFQVLLPHKMSQWGPALCQADLNGDGLEDIFLGAASRSTGGIYLQNEKGGYERLQAFEGEKMKEDNDAIFFDVDNDEDLDLFVVSGAYELPYQKKYYSDRLYLNEGGKFILYENLPKILSSGSCVRPFDYDSDGDLDIFVGGRLMPAQYPQAGKSYLLRNNLDQGKLSFEDVTQEIIPEVDSIGMVTDAQWSDYNDDGNVDLVVVGEWMPITIFLHKDGKYQNATDKYELSESRGWWFSISSSDLDNDGDMDYVVGNLGRNYKYQASPNASFDLYVDDFDNNASNDIVLGYYNDKKQYPVRGRQCSSDQIPGIKTKFKNYESFAVATIDDIYGEAQLNNAEHYQIKDFSSIALENLGKGQYKQHVLPNECQLSAINDILLKDFDNDGNLDILVAGNLYVSEVETPRSDAGIGLLLLGDGKFNFKPQSYAQSGLMLNTDVKKVISVKGKNEDYLIAASNDGPVLIHKFQQSNSIKDK